LEYQLKLTRDAFAIGKMVALKKHGHKSDVLPFKFTSGSDFCCGWFEIGKYGGSTFVFERGQSASVERFP
jgi:hypothetical protein